MPIKRPLTYLIRRAKEKGHVMLYFYWRLSYEKRAFTYRNRGKIEVYRTRVGKWHLFIDEPGHVDFISKDYKTLSSLKRFLKRWFDKNGRVAIFVKPGRGGGGEFISLRNLLGTTIDETDAWKIIMARALGHLNYRRLYGIKVYKSSAKRCVMCDKPTNVALIFGWDDGTRYSVPYCHECLEIRIIEAIREHVEEVLEGLREGIERIREGETEPW